MHTSRLGDRQGFNKVINWELEKLNTLAKSTQVVCSMLDHLTLGSTFSPFLHVGQYTDSLDACTFDNKYLYI